MKIKKLYSTPQSTENIIANSPTSFTFDEEHNDGGGGAAGVGRRGFWNEV